MSRLTIYLARLLGLFTLIAALAMIVRQNSLAETVQALVDAPAVLFIFGLLVLAAGLAIVIAHNVWSGGVATVIVTLYGWILTIRGVLLLTLPSDTIANVIQSLRFGEAPAAYAAIPLVLGLYLTYAGFSAHTAGGPNTGNAPA